MSSTTPFDIIEHRIPSSYIREYPHALANSQEDTLTLAVKQYRPVSNTEPLPKHAVTIIAAHANGFPKELYEPLFADLLAACHSQSPPIIIRSIWIADIAHQNASGILNEDLLGNDPGWYDHARDLTYLINLKRAEMPRPLFGLGHSVGGNNLVNVSLFNPRLFEGIILIDPVIQIHSAEPQSIQDGGPIKPRKGPSVAQLSTFRRDTWPSRSSAAESFRRSPFYKTWDSRVLDRWIQFGLRDLPTGSHPDKEPPGVTLTTTVANEVHHFLRPNYEGYNADKPPNRETHADLDPSADIVAKFYRPESTRTFFRLQEVRPAVLYLFGSQSDVSDAETDELKISRTGTGVGGSGGRAEGRVKGVTMDKVGHLIAMEAPTRAAEECASWLKDEMQRYRKQEEKWEREWLTKGLREKQVVSEKWRKTLGGGPPKKNKNATSKL